MRRSHLFTFGPSGIFEQDDMNNFNQCTVSGKTWAGKKVMINQQLGLGHEQTGEQIPGMTQETPSEINQRAFYGFWAEMMDAPSWNQVKPTPRKV